jgi:hypothetical protein
MFLVAIGLFGQAKVMPDREAEVASELDTLSLPAEHPEWALARRAMASEGLCHLSPSAPADSGVAAPAADLPDAAIDGNSIVRLVAYACE